MNMINLFTNYLKKDIKELQTDNKLYIQNNINNLIDEDERKELIELNCHSCNEDEIKDRLIIFEKEIN